MADILIRGMEMPKDCPHCEFAAIGYESPMSTEYTLYCRAVDKFKDCETVVIKEKSYEVLSQYDSRPDWCPLIPLSEGHGRLIDGDAFKADCLAATKEAKPDFIRHEDWLKSCAVTMSFCRDIDEQPTIVPAEGGTDDG